MKEFIKLLMLLIIIISVAGCGGGGSKSEPNTYGAVLQGTVTDYRGGSAVQGATVIAPFGTATTDSKGQFKLNFKDDAPVDLLVQKEGRASVRIQGISLQPDQKLDLEVPSRPRISSSWTNNPPRITLTGVSPGDTVSGILSLDIAVGGDHDTYVAYVYFGGEQRFPNSGIVVGDNQLAIDIDTARYQNGLSYVKILAYDVNDNAVLYIVPVTVQNGEDPDAAVSSIAVLHAVSTSFGQNIGYYSKQRESLFNKYNLQGDPNILKLKGGDEIDLRSVPAGAAIYNMLTWSAASGAQGYNVYRSFDGVNYRKIGSVISGRYDDYSSELAVNQKTYYKVVPYNGSVEGTPSMREVTPLPTYNVYLQSPSNNATYVTLSPTFRWRNQLSAPMPSDVEFTTVITLYDATNFRIWESEDYDVTEKTYPGTLTPGSVYSWDIIESSAFCLYYYAGDGYSYAISYSSMGPNSQFGSVNGEFVFTTTTTVSP